MGIKKIKNQINDFDFFVKGKKQDVENLLEM